MNTFASLSGVPYGKTGEEHRAYMRWWRNLNRKEYNAKRLEWANGHRERRRLQSRRSHLMKRFGITIEDYERLSAKQGHKCIICEKPMAELTDTTNRLRPNMSIDHNHKTGEISGILCNNCNVALGLFSENPNILIRAAEYLETKNADDKGVTIEDVRAEDMPR